MSIAANWPILAAVTVLSFLGIVSIWAVAEARERASTIQLPDPAIRAECPSTPMHWTTVMSFATGSCHRCSGNYGNPQNLSPAAMQA